MGTRNRAQAAKHSRDYRARHKEKIAKRCRAWRQANPAIRAMYVRTYRARLRRRRMNRARVARWRAANPDRARQQWRDYYYRRLKPLRCGIDPTGAAA